MAWFYPEQHDTDSGLSLNNPYPVLLAPFRLFKLQNANLSLREAAKIIATGNVSPIRNMHARRAPSLPYLQFFPSIQLRVQDQRVRIWIGTRHAPSYCDVRMAILLMQLYTKIGGISSAIRYSDCLRKN